MTFSLPMRFFLILTLTFDAFRSRDNMTILSAFHTSMVNADPRGHDIPAH
jgi:hypothetical protein